MLFSADEIARYCPEQTEPGTALWPFKQDLEKLAVIEYGDPYTYASQYQQNPSPLGGGMFKDEYWRYYDELPSDIITMRMYCDTAQKVKEQNDFSVFEVWARSVSQGIFLVDLLRGKWKAPELESNFVDFWNKHKPSIYKPMGVHCAKIEDKSSGSSLIQSIEKDYMIPVEPIPRNTDKVFRAMGVVKYFASGKIHVPRNAPWLHDFKEEFRKFTPLMNHAHDDQIDPAMDAVEDLLVNEDLLYSSESLS